MRKKAMCVVIGLLICATFAFGTGTSESSGESELPVLKYLGPFARFDVDTDPSAAVYEEVTGYQWEFSMLPQANASDKLNLVMSSGEVYDLVHSPTDLYFRYAGQGALTPLDDLLAEHGTDVVRALTEPVLETARVNGEVFGMPHPRLGGGKMVDTALFLRQDWVDAVGMSVPTTTDGLRDLLQAFKNQNPGGTGYVIPLSHETWNVPGLTGAFGVGTNYVVVGDTVVDSVNLPGMVEYLTYMNGLYEDGLFDAEFPVNQRANVQEKLVGGSAGLAPFTIYLVAALYEGLGANFPDAELVMMDFPTGPNGDRGIYSSLAHYAVKVIPAVSDNAEHVMRAVNNQYLLEPRDNLLYLYDGEEGVHYNVVDGEIVPIDPIFGEERGNMSYYMAGVEVERGMWMWSPRLQKNPQLAESFAILQGFSDATVNNIADVAPPIDSVISSQERIRELKTEYFTKFIAGALPLSDYDVFLAEWERAGGAEAEADLNAWYQSR